MSVKCDTCNTIKSNWDNTKFWLTLTSLLSKEDFCSMECLKKFCLEIKEEKMFEEEK